MATQESTMFKSFSSFSELQRKTAGYSWCVRLAGCGWFVPVSKKALKKVSESMKKHDNQFSGKIVFLSGGLKYVQITLS